MAEVEVSTISVILDYKTLKITTNIDFMKNRKKETIFIFKIGSINILAVESVQLICRDLTLIYNPIYKLRDNSQSDYDPPNLSVTVQNLFIPSTLSQYATFDYRNKKVFYFQVYYTYTGYEIISVYYIPYEEYIIDSEGSIRYTGQNITEFNGVYGYITEGQEQVQFTTQDVLVIQSLHVSQTKNFVIRNAKVVVEGDCTVSGFLQCNSLIL